MELPEQDGRVQCLECGRWFKSLIGHISRIHGMSAEEYRAVHGLARTTALVASSVSEQLHDHGIRRRDADPRVLEALSGDGARRQRAAAFPRAREPRRPATKKATQAAKQQQGELRLHAALDAAGWGSLAEAVEWARTEGPRHPDRRQLGTHRGHPPPTRGLPVAHLIHPHPCSPPQWGYRGADPPGQPLNSCHRPFRRR